MNSKLAYILLTGFILSVFAPYLPYVHYYLYQKEIEETLCINRFKPEVQCHGSCILKEDLRKVYESDVDHSFPVPSKSMFLPKPRWVFSPFVLSNGKTQEMQTIARHDPGCWIFTYYPSIDAPPPKLG